MTNIFNTRYADGDKFESNKEIFQDIRKRIETAQHELNQIRIEARAVTDSIYLDKDMDTKCSSSTEIIKTLSSLYAASYRCDDAISSLDRFENRFSELFEIGGPE